MSGSNFRCCNFSFSLSTASGSSLEMAVVARGLTGLGQGILFIGVQTYILAKAHRDSRTKANGIIVHGFQGGMISLTS